MRLFYGSLAYTNAASHLLVAPFYALLCNLHVPGTLFSVEFKNTGTSAHFTVMFAGLSMSRCSLV